MTINDADRHFLIPKLGLPGYVPAMSDVELSWIIGGLMPEERRALAKIIDAADLLTVEGQAYLVAPVDNETLDTLAAFEAEAAERENDLEDEPILDDGAAGVATQEGMLPDDDNIGHDALLAPMPILDEKGDCIDPIKLHQQRQQRP